MSSPPRSFARAASTAHREVARPRARKPGSEAVAGAVRAEVWSRYRANTPRYLMGIARDFQHRAMARLSRAGFEELRPSLGPPISLVALAPRSLGSLAQLLAISPQAASQLVGLGERAGYLERRRDPTDRRARLVHLTARGAELVAEATRILAAIEDEYRTLVGETAFLQLTGALGALFEGLGLPAHDDAQISSRSHGSIGTLSLLSVRFQRDLMEATAARGHRGLKMSHAQVLPLIGPNGARVNELARVQRVSRQAISTTARDLEQLGVLRREAAAEDGRAVVYRLTARGERLIRDSVAAVDALDARLAEVLGDRGLVEFREALGALYRSLHLEEEIFAASPPRATASRHRTAANETGHGPDPEPAELDALAERLRRRLAPRDRERLAALLAAGGSSRPETTPDRARSHSPDASSTPIE